MMMRHHRMNPVALISAGTRGGQPLKRGLGSAPAPRTLRGHLLLYYNYKPRMPAAALLLRTVCRVSCAVRGMLCVSRAHSHSQ